MRRLLALSVGALIFTVVGLASAQISAERQRAQIQNRLGWEYMKAENWEAAARAFQQAIEIDPQYEYAFYGLGRARLSGKKYVDAIDALSKCRDLYRAQAGKRFANTQEAQRYRQDRITEIDEQIRQAQSLNPQSVQAQELLRQLNNQKRDIQLAIDRSTTNMTIAETVPAWVSLSLGSAYFRAGKLGDAEREYKATIEIDPKSGEAHNNLAVVYLETGRYAEAEAAIKDAKKVGFRVSPQLEQEIKERKRTGS